MSALLRRLSLWISVLAALLPAPAAIAHGGGTPRHGGVVQMANDLSFELVAQEDGATIYIEDHDKPMATAGFGGKLGVLLAGVKADAPLKPATPNALVANGLKFGPGAKVVAVITTPQNQSLAVRFTLR
ncbi:MAG: hypothetical protein HY020_01305 [Burkholderiales bacterium]|nr:hypothetical protein [Burkholderiales bacterium]